MARLSPVLPLVGPDTRFQPVYVDDVAAAAAAGARPGAAAPGVYELGGPEVATFRELMQRMLGIIQRRRMLVALPFGLAGIQAPDPRLPAARERRAVRQRPPHPRPGAPARPRQRRLAGRAAGWPSSASRRPRWTRCSRAISTPTDRTGQYDAMTDLRAQPAARGPDLDPELAGRGPPRRARGADRVHPGLLDRPHAARRPLPRLPLDRQGLRGADPARRHPRHPSVYSGRLLELAAAAADRPAARAASSLGVLLAFLPAVVLGVLLHDFIKTVLFETPDADRRHADPRRHRAALGRPPARAPRLPRRHGLPAADGARRSGSSSVSR